MHVIFTVFVHIFINETCLRIRLILGLDSQYLLTKYAVPNTQHQHYASGPVACLPCFECVWLTYFSRSKGLCKFKSNSLSKGYFKGRHDLYFLKLRFNVLTAAI